MGFGTLNMLYGNLMALRQSQVKRLLAYSSLSYIWLYLLGLGIAIFSHQNGGADGGFLPYFQSWYDERPGIFSCRDIALRIETFSRKSRSLGDFGFGRSCQSLSCICPGIEHSCPWAGRLPPLAGFMSKWQIVTAGFVTQDIFVVCLVVFAALNSVLSLAYYAPLVNTMYRSQPGQVVATGAKIQRQC